MFSFVMGGQLTLLGGAIRNCGVVSDSTGNARPRSWSVSPSKQKGAFTFAVPTFQLSLPTSLTLAKPVWSIAPHSTEVGNANVHKSDEKQRVEEQGNVR